MTLNIIQLTQNHKQEDKVHVFRIYLALSVTYTIAIYNIKNICYYIFLII